MLGSVAGTVKETPPLALRSFARTERSPPSAITKIKNHNKSEKSLKTHTLLKMMYFNLTTGALKRTVGLASLKAGKQGLISL
jgi:hypothetical protein